MDQDKLQPNTRVNTAIKFWSYTSQGISCIVERFFILFQDSFPLTQIVIKGKGKFPVHCTKASGGMEELFHSFLISALDTDGW
jgi:hypothetical protein